MCSASHFLPLPLTIFLSTFACDGGRIPKRPLSPSVPANSLKAGASSLGFALVRLLTAVHMRRLKHQRLRTHSDLQKTTQRLFSIEGSLHVERTSQTSTNREIVAASHFGEVCTSAYS